MNTRRRAGCAVLSFAGLGLVGALVALCVLVMSVGLVGGAGAMAENPTRIPAASISPPDATSALSGDFPSPTPSETPTVAPTATPMPSVIPLSSPTRMGPLPTATAGFIRPTPMIIVPPGLRTPLPSATTGPQATPTAAIEATSTQAPPTVPSTGGGEEIAATETAMAFDAQATNDQAADASAPAQPPQVAMVTREFAIYDDAGAELGSGQVRVYAPAQVGLDSVAEIRIEIVTNVVVAEGTSTMNPPFTPTPLLVTPKPTNTPLPLIDSQFVIVREYMGAGLRGPDMSNFKVDPVPPSGLRRIQAGAVNWWKWTIRPVGEQAVGANNLEIYIYLPRTRSDGTAFNEETNTIPLQIEVIGKRPGPRGDSSGMLLAVAGALVAIGGAGGAFYGTFRFARQMRQGQASTAQPVTVEGKPGAEDEIEVKVSGNVDGQVTIAGDDVITYQTVIQRMPVSLVIGLIIGLAALVIGLAVIMVVLTGGLAPL